MSKKAENVYVEISVDTKQPVTFTHHGIDGLPMMTRGVDGEGRPMRTVFLPAAQLRGRLRHEAALAVMRSKGESVKLEDAYMLALGQDLHPEENKEPEAIRLGDQIKFRKENPFLDLFGTWKVASRLFVAHLLPETNVYADRFSHIRRDLDTNEAVFDQLPEAEVNRFYERQDAQSLASQAGGMIKATEAAMKKARKDKNTELIEELEAKLEQLKTRKKEHKGDDDSENTKHLVQLEAIPAGITLTGKLIIQQATGYDVTTIVNAIDGISQAPMFGAQRARGCGEIAGKASVRAADGEVLATIEFGGFQPASVQWTQRGTQLCKV